MAKEVLDIVDTAVKIGLGALISGVATYYVTKLKHTEEAAQEYGRRKWEFIKDVIDTTDEYMLALGNLVAALDGLRKDHPEAKTIEETGERDFVEKHDDILQDAVLQRNRAFSRLKIIGEAKAAENLNKLHELEDEIRSGVIFESELPSSKKLEDWYRRIRETRETFLSELALRTTN
jgi:hypothetical protein